MPKLTCRWALQILPLLPLALSCVGAQAQPAAPLTQEQTASLDRAVSLWTSGYGGVGKDSAWATTLAPEGDHYLLTMSLPKQMGKTGVSITAADLVAHVRPLDGGRWEFDTVHGMTPITVVTPPAADGKRVRMALDVADQTGQAVIDPTLAASSSFDTKFGTLSADIESGASLASIHAQGGSDHSGWQPAGPGRVDVSRTTEIHDLIYDIAQPKKVTFRVKTLHADSHVAGFDPSKLALVAALGQDILRAAPAAKAGGTQQAAPPPAPPPAADTTPPPPQGDAGKTDTGKTDTGKMGGTQQAAPPPPPAAAADTASTPPGKPQLTAQQRAQLHQVIDGLRGMFASGDVTLVMTGIDVLAEGHDVTLAKASVSEAFATPEGKFDAHMRLAVEGLVSPDIPPGIARDFLPHRLIIAPHVSGLPANDVFDLIGQAIDQQQPNQLEMQARAAALLAKGPVTAGFDELAFDLGPALFSASGSIKLSGPTPKGLTGSAVIEAHGLSALIKRANTDPMVKQAAPVLIFLKGIGDEDDSGNVIWKVTYGDGKVLVNGTDLSQLVPHK